MAQGGKGRTISRRFDPSAPNHSDGQEFARLPAVSVFVPSHRLFIRDGTQGVRVAIRLSRRGRNLKLVEGTRTSESTATLR